MNILFEFTKAEVLRLCKESDYFLERVVSRLEPGPTPNDEEQRFTKIARDAFVEGQDSGGIIPAIKAVRIEADRLVPIADPMNCGRREHKYYGLRNAKEFVERVCSDLIAIRNRDK